MMELKVAKCVVILLFSQLTHTAHQEGYPGEYEGVPSPYHYEYKVQDPKEYLDFGQEEEGDGNGRVEGYYHVQLPDGRLQRVDYQVDGYSGYIANVKYNGEAQHPNIGHHESNIGGFEHHHGNNGHLVGGQNTISHESISNNGHNGFGNLASESNSLNHKLGHLGSGHHGGYHQAGHDSHHHNSGHYTSEHESGYHGSEHYKRRQSNGHVGSEHIDAGYASGSHGLGLEHHHEYHDEGHTSLGPEELGHGVPFVNFGSEHHEQPYVSGYHGGYESSEYHEPQHGHNAIEHHVEGHVSEYHDLSHDSGLHISGHHEAGHDRDYLSLEQHVSGQNNGYHHGIEPHQQGHINGFVNFGSTSRHGKSEERHPVRISNGVPQPVLEGGKAELFEASPSDTLKSVQQSTFFHHVPTNQKIEKEAQKEQLQFPDHKQDHQAHLLSVHRALENHVQNILKERAQGQGKQDTEFYFSGKVGGISQTAPNKPHNSILNIQNGQFSSNKNQLSKIEPATFQEVNFVSDFEERDHNSPVQGHPAHLLSDINGNIQRQQRVLSETADQDVHDWFDDGQVIAGQVVHG